MIFEEKRERGRKRKGGKRKKKIFINRVIILIDNNIWSCYNKCYNTLFFKRATVRAFITIELKSYNAILALSMYQKCLAEVEAKV